MTPFSIPVKMSDFLSPVIKHLQLKKISVQKIVSIIQLFQKDHKNNFV